ncbi:type II secretion system protein [Anaerohalosphaera lusitana]|nr:type II secretion system protein [Anaerohalosphaera lusitana]
MFKAKGFTLIELLVVISIIALLLAIMMPALGMVKEKAKDVICRTNLKNIQLASLMYAQNNDGKMPPYSFGNALWVNKLGAYSGEMDEVRYCPSTKIRKDTPAGSSWGGPREAWVWFYDGMEEPEQGSYTINTWFYSSGRFGADETRNYRSLDDTRRPGNVPIFADGIWIDSIVDDTDYVPDDYNLDDPTERYGGNMCVFITNRHKDHTNLGFADGSQRPVDFSELWSLKWHKEFDTVKEKTRDDGSPIYQP